jgi:transposase-like protein
MRARAVRIDSAEKTIRHIRRATRRQYSAEDKIRVVLGGLRGETSIAECCRKEGIEHVLRLVERVPCASPRHSGVGGATTAPASRRLLPRAKSRDE